MQVPLMHITNLLPLDFLRRKTGVNPLIVNYHMVSDDKLSHVSSLYKYRDKKTFIQDLDFFIRNFYPITLHDLLANITDNVKLPENSLLLTFDDGFKEIYEVVAPIFADKELTATVFLTKNFVDNKELGYDNKKSILLDQLHYSTEKTIQKQIVNALRSNNIIEENLIKAILSIPYNKRQVVDEIGATMNINFLDYLTTNKPYLTSYQINKLIDLGFTFGGHSIDHPNFSELSLKDQIYQATDSVEFSVNSFGLDYRVFAFPYTDLKLTKSFFKAIADKVDATFGTTGLLLDTVKTNFQRISVEKLTEPACITIKYHYVRKMIYQFAGKDLIKRLD